jgi:hypothetical protein
VSWLLDNVGHLVVIGLNALIAALGTVIAGLFSLLPDMPALPTLPDAMVTAEAWVAWVFPVSTVFDILVFGFSMWLLWQAVALALRWARALQS